MPDDDDEAKLHGEPTAHVPHNVPQSDVPQDVPQEMDHLADVDVTDRNAMRCPETGKFIKGWKGGGRKKGSKDKLNQQVIGTMEKLWAQRGEEIMDHLADTKPEVLAGLIARLIPQSLAEEAIQGKDSDEISDKNQEVRITLINQSKDDAALTHSDIPKLVEGEVLPPDSMH
jgi:hypothetical protein